MTWLTLGMVGCQRESTDSPVFSFSAHTHFAYSSAR